MELPSAHRMRNSERNITSTFVPLGTPFTNDCDSLMILSNLRKKLGASGGRSSWGEEMPTTLINHISFTTNISVTQ